MEYKAQYQEYLLQATAALDAASARFLPEESEVCRAARYSLLGGGKRIRAILTLRPSAICWAARCRQLHSLQQPWRCCIATR